jgi:SAM-dependent methyltransferase
VTAFSTRPLHVISLTGLLIAAFAIFFIAWLIWRKLAFDIEVEGWTSVMATTLLLGGVTIFFVGILAIYLATVFIEVKQRPLTTIREIINEYRNTIETDKSSVSSYGCHSIFKPDRMAIVRHHERCLGRPGEASHADDPKSEELDRIRYDAMLGLLMHETERVTLLDFGCGQGDLKHHIDRKGLIHIQYEGLEISSAFAEAARRRFPQVTIRCVDVLKGEIILPQYDYIVMNGIFTRRDELSEPEMFAYLESLVSRLFRHAKRGLAFNVMSPIADRKNESLFHPSFDAIAAIITRSISRNLVLRNDYGLRECTCYIYRETRAR